MPAKTIISPQSGFQENFARSNADIVIGGGAAGVGKTFALLMEPLYYYQNPKFGGVYFRRTTPEITAEGALWDEANNIYSRTVGGKPLSNSLTWRFPVPKGARRGAKIQFSHLEREQDKYRHKGAQYNFIAFDELTSFTETQFWYLLSRNRSVSGIRPFVRATTNPQTEGWVKSFISWWLYPDDYPQESDAGFPIPERNGKKRYLFKQGSTRIWGDTRDDVIDQARTISEVPPEKLIDLIKSVTFVGGSIYDNKELLTVDPGYLGNLSALPEDERAMQLDGCWKYRSGLHDLFNYSPLVDMFHNDFVEPTGRRYITADIALQGSDKFVILVWDGMVVTHIEEHDTSTPEYVAARIKQLASDFGVPRSRIAYDGIGNGSYLMSYLKGAIPFIGTHSPKPFRGEKRPPYENLRTQCYYLLKEAVDKALIYIRDDRGEMQQTIIEELRATKRRDVDKTTPNMRILKKEQIKSILGRSPDYADAIMMRMVFFLLSSSGDSYMA